MHSSNAKGLKIVILVSAFMGDGAERQAYLLAREWRERHGLDVEVWALWAGEHTKPFEAAGIPIRALYFARPRCPVRWVRGLYWSRRLLRVVGQLKERRVDVLLPFGGWANVVAAFTHKFAGVKVCIWGERAVGRARGERLAARRYRRFVANSSAGIEYLTSQMHVPSDRIALIPNGVEECAPSLPGEVKAKLSLKPEQFMVVKVAVLDGTRDHQTLLRAWKIVQQMWAGPDKPVLVLAGRFGDTHAECRQIVRKEGLESTVRFLGVVQDATALISAADLAVFSSNRPTLPNALLEYMIAAKAVVASDVAGVRDALGNEAGETLVPSGDADAFARAVLSLLCDPEMRKRIGEANRDRARSEFSVARFAESYLRVVEECLPNARRPLQPVAAGAKVSA